MGQYGINDVASFSIPDLEYIDLYDEKSYVLDYVGNVF